MPVPVGSELREPTLGDGIRRLTEAALVSESSDHLWPLAAELAKTLLGADVVVCFERLGSERSLVRAASGAPELITSVPIPIAPDSQAAFVYRSDGPLTVRDLSSETRFTAGSMMVNLGMRSSVSWRLGTSSKTLGVIGAFSKFPGFFGPDDAETLRILAAGLEFGLLHVRKTRLLERRAYVDELTGIANRASILAALESRMMTKGGPNGFICALMIDLDGFKKVNDEHGHHVGDEALRLIAQKISQTVGSDDLVGRLGGDEFLVLLHQRDDDEVFRMAERIVGAIEQVMVIGTVTIELSAAIGIAAIRDQQSVTSVLQASDRAMYEAKSDGRGRVARSRCGGSPGRTNGRPAQSATSPSGLDLAAVDAAIAGVRVLFQPIVRTSTHEIVGIEALARGPEGSPLMSPDRLFGVAETFGRLADLEVATKRAAFNHPVPDDVTLFINIDPNVIVNDKALSLIIDAWRDSGRRGLVVVELTERSLMAAPGPLLRAIERCRAVGWSIALDDMGAKAESLAALRIAKPDIVKLDMQLMKNSSRAQAASLVASLATYCERYQVEVVAEGVETDANEFTAELLGATLLQGFKFYAPTSFENLVLRHPIAPVRSGHVGLHSATAFMPRMPSSGVQPERVATKEQLLSFSRHLESIGSAADTVVLAALQHVENYTPRTRRQYAALARRFGLVGVVGAGIPGGVASGVKHGCLSPDDDLVNKWQVVVFSSGSSIALLAEQIDGHPGGRTTREKLFRFRFATSPDEVEAVARRILSHL